MHVEGDERAGGLYTTWRHFVVLVLQFLRPQSVSQALRLFVLPPDLTALMIDVLRDQTRSKSLAHERRVLGNGLVLGHQEPIFTTIVHDHVFELDSAHDSLLVIEAEFHDGLVRRDHAPLVAQVFTLGRVGQRIFLAFLLLLLALPFADFGDPVVQGV